MIFILLIVLNEGLKVILVNKALVVFIKEVECLQDQIKVFLLQLLRAEKLSSQL